MMFEIVTNNSPVFKSRLKKFIDSELNSENSFRYYNNRDINIINAHILTCIFFNYENNIAYGHLDLENNNVWLGIFVSKKYKGIGFGKKMMDYLLSYSKEKKIKSINLSVDSNNYIAYNLYLKCGFKKIKTKDSKIFMNRKLYEK